MKIRFLSKREINLLIEQLNEFSSFNIDSKIKQVKSIELSEDVQILHSKYFIFIQTEGNLIPFLRNNTILENFPKVIVDKGAIQFVCKGANIMRPGIVDIPDNFNQDDLVVIIEELHNKSLAIGKTMYSSSEMLDLDTGAVIKNLHYVGDAIWNNYKEINFDSLS